MAEGGTGLVFGKFDPPHRGHALLVDVAIARCERLIVLVYDYATQTVPAQTRARWMQEIQPDADVRIIPEDPLEIDPNDAGAQAAHVRTFLNGEPISIVFTSEAYGEAFARALGATHVSIDRDRWFVPCTGTMVRRSPLDYLEWMEPCVRAYYVKRITIVGSESTGKTSLCAFLAGRFETLWVAEYGREYTEMKAKTGPVRWITDEFYHIAREQQRREDECARRANRVLFCDTDALATRIWHERYMGSDVASWPLPRSRASLYLIPFPDVPFVADEIRDSEHLRYWMYERFIESFERLGYPYEILQGSYEERREQAVAAVERECALTTTP
ncbi:MAG TPA: AAA family ATPase [Candidatus Baltobacteraceae bacterium]|nr:AAA family ATPase [Candidatus Baltobacteraceae bacterium]